MGGAIGWLQESSGRSGVQRYGGEWLSVDYGATSASSVAGSTTSSSG